MKIAVTNLNPRLRLNTNFIKKLTKKILGHIKKASNVEIEVVFLDDRVIRRLNKAYRKKDRPTDVLSFNMGAKDFRSDRIFGEVIISSDTAFRNSKIFKTEFEEEIILCAIHGILHLAGYEDERPKDARRMSGLQNRILRSLCAKEDLSKVSMPR